MALASASCKTVSRGGGRSATAAAAYRTAEKIADLRTGEVHDYRRRGGVDHVSMHAPMGAPTMTTAELWNKAEAAEKRKNSTVARELVVALPHELDQEQRRELADRIAGQLVERYQVAAQVAVHLPGAEGDKRNHHAHIMFTTRTMDASGQLGAKTRQLDHLTTGPEEVLWMRGMVEAETNTALEQAGSAARIDMRSLAAQHAEAVAMGDQVQAAATDRPATVHMGPRVTAIARECAKAKREPLGQCDRIEEVQQAMLQRDLARVSAQIIDIEQARAARAASTAAVEAKAEAQRAAELARIEQQRQERIKAAPEVAAAARRLATAHSNVEHAQAVQRQLVNKIKPLVHERNHCRQEAQRWREAHPIRSFFHLDKPARQLEERAATAHAKAVNLDGQRQAAKASEQQHAETVPYYEHQVSEAEAAAGREPEPPSQELHQEQAQWVEFDQDGTAWGHWSDQPDQLHWHDGHDWIKYEEQRQDAGPRTRM